MFVFHTLLQEIKENYRRLSVSRAAVQQLFSHVSENGRWKRRVQVLSICRGFQKYIKNVFFLYLMDISVAGLCEI